MFLYLLTDELSTPARQMLQKHSDRISHHLSLSENSSDVIYRESYL